MKIRAYMRRWAFLNEPEYEVKNPKTGRMALATKFLFKRVSEERISNNDVPLVAAEDTERLVDALRPFAALLQPDAVGAHAASQPDDQGVYAINRAVITLGDLRRARAALDAVAPAAARSAPPAPFGQPGGMDDETGRIGLTIEQWRHTDDPDLPVYWHIADSMGGEEWAYIDGIDLHTDGLHADVWFESGGCLSVPVSTVVYMARKHAEPLLPANLRAALRRENNP